MKYLRKIARFARVHVFGCLWAVYLAGSALCWYFLPAASHLDARPDYVASRDLVENHRIVSGDLKKPSAFAASAGFYLEPADKLEGRYLKKATSAGQPLHADNVSERPDLQLKNAAVRAIPFPLSKGSIPARFLEAGAAVVLVGSNPRGTTVIGASVIAVICEKGNGQNCYPMLAVPVGQAALVENNLGALRLLLNPLDPNVVLGSN